ncbi:MAG: cupin domain-containing protein [Burkholderiales bacterium]|nr:cupin domain-containing protein [Burkholderiales bacterium]
MSTADKTQQKTRTEGAIKGGDGKYIFPMTQMEKIEAGVGYSTAIGPVIEGERMQCGLITKPRGTGSRPHLHPNEQWNYIVKGTLRVKVGDQPEQLCGPGTLLYFPANIVHYTISTPEEDVVFFAVKDMTHGIIGKAADGTMAGGHYDPGFEEKK